MLVVHLTDVAIDSWMVQGVVDVVKRDLAGNYVESNGTGYGPERQDFGAMMRELWSIPTKNMTRAWDAATHI